MVRTRLTLHEMLCDILGSRNCYFSPPSKGMKYPCIKYDLAGQYGNFADNVRWMKPKRWTLTYIDENPDSEMYEKLLAIPYCSFDRLYKADNLNHFVFTLYY